MKFGICNPHLRHLLAAAACHSSLRTVGFTSIYLNWVVQRSDLLGLSRTQHDSPSPEQKPCYWVRVIGGHFLPTAEPFNISAFYFRNFCFCLLAMSKIRRMVRHHPSAPAHKRPARHWPPTLHNRLYMSSPGCPSRGADCQSAVSPMVNRQWDGAVNPSSSRRIANPPPRFQAVAGSGPTGRDNARNRLFTNVF